MFISQRFMVAGLCHFVFSHGVFLKEKTPCEKTKIRQTKRCHSKKRKDATRKDDKIKVSNGVFSSFRAESSSFHVLDFVFSRYFVFCLFARHCFIFSHGVFSSFHLASFRREKMKWHKPLTILFDVLDNSTFPKGGLLI